MEKERGLGGRLSGGGGPGSDPSLDEVATPWRDVTAVVAVEKLLQFLRSATEVSHLEEVWWKGKKKKYELFREQPSA